MDQSIIEDLVNFHNCFYFGWTPMNVESNLTRIGIGTAIWCLKCFVLSQQEAGKYFQIHSIKIQFIFLFGYFKFEHTVHLFHYAFIHQNYRFFIGWLNLIIIWACISFLFLIVIKSTAKSDPIRNLDSSATSWITEKMKYISYYISIKLFKKD